MDYSGGHIRRTEWKFLAEGSVRIGYEIDFDGVVDIFGVSFDLPESSVVSKRWVGKGPYRVWQNRMQGPQFGYWETGYNDPIPGETFEYPEFKGYFAEVGWMDISVGTGRIILDELPESSYVGVFTPRDGRDSYLLICLRSIPIQGRKEDPDGLPEVESTEMSMLS